jgi:hypothetical protein
MMGHAGRATATLVLLALLLPPAPAGSADPRGFEGRGTLCHSLLTYDVDAGDLCPHVRQAGVASPGPCEGETCVLLVTIEAQGAGVPALRKTLTIDATLDGVPQGDPVCASEAMDAAVACQSTDALVTLDLPEGACRLLRIGSTMGEAADVPPTLPIRAENGFLACRAGALLTLE